jgi:hypothetical protein
MTHEPPGGIVSLVTFAGGRRTDRALGRADMHGGWLALAPGGPVSRG